VTDVSRKLSAVRDASEEARAAHRKRDQTIRKAKEAGASLRAIGEAANLTHARIQQIVKGK
jgi:hypothetical protein